ncbi:MAG: radical SAM protein, partial [Planctomycetes bacterium]|nr:radical SAM protein [Planctomycetota bacterium]
RAMGMLTGISTYASPTRLADGTLDSLITLARDLPVNELLIWDEMPVGRYAGNPDIAPLGSPYYAELQRFVDGRQKETRDIGIWSYQRMRSYSGSGCMAGVSTFEVAADGGVQPCDFCRTCIGNVNEKPLLDLWHALTVLAAGRRSRHHGCWILNDMAEKRSSR